MFSAGTVFLVFLGYMATLFAIAQLVERSPSISQYLSERPWVYALSITVYCTSWTFYGSVGLASRQGLAYLPTYLGPTLAIGLWWVVLRKIVRIKERRHITSIADFISARYDRSQGVAMVVTLIALIGTLPYIAIQLKAVVSSFSVITGGSTSQLDWDGLGLWATVLLIAFTVLFGARRLDPTERHQGMMTALAVECVVKLVAFLAVGIFATFGLFGGFDGLYASLPQADWEQLTRVGSGETSAYTRWMTVLFVSMAGILFLPRQFHTAVVENSNENHIRTAIWLVPAYLLLISLFVVPLAAAGRALGLPVELSDSYVLLLPLQADQQALSMLVFLGGLAAASGMIIVSSVTLATMSTNHLLVPLIDRIEALHGLRRYLLPARWLTIAVVILVSYLFARELTTGRALANVGMLGFVAALQFVPVIFGGLFWLKGNKAGATMGLGLGFLVWFYTLMVPLLAQSGQLPLSLVTDGPWGIYWLKPEALFGMDRFDSVTHASFWSLFFNTAAYLLGSVLLPQKESELELASSYVHAFRYSAEGVEQGPDEAGQIAKDEKLGEARVLLEQYFSEKIARSKIRQISEGMGVIEKDFLSAGELLRFHRELERVLAGSIGTAAAHKAMKKHLSYSKVEHEQVSHVYAGILANLRLTPDELLERISYFEERDRIQREHARELENRVLEREREIRARKKIERELERSVNSQRLLNELLRTTLEPKPLKQALERALALVCQQRWLQAESKGAIFLADDERQQLRLYVSQGLDPHQLTRCDQVAFGQCICGRVAQNRQLIHTEAVSSQQPDQHCRLSAHGHYAVPIRYEERLLGVLILYLSEGHQPGDEEIDFLDTVSYVLGGLIQRKWTEKALADSGKQGLPDSESN
ncbi:GAF domain-containing protein [Motiliproteus coralliicola]|uniref:GAF domain-containing protein n=1 Tax=Motiliproteus coralliicola TaxID=2283196 RepID=A0A369WC37_9GAMM|nr:GAF domain-containing protein [Motiliproteus coralliicola]RDE18186.1 GAF domain-containing protein [Motiliproteus coralliicola]